VSKVLVTGGSGFVGSYVILQLLAAGHSVRTTLRTAQGPIVSGSSATLPTSCYARLHNVIYLSLRQLEFWTFAMWGRSATQCRLRKPA